MKKSDLKRRDFLKKLGICLPAMPLMLNSGAYARDSLAAGDNHSAHCGFTDHATAGPFFVRNTAERVNLNVLNMPGRPMTVMGTVYGGTDGETPLANAKIEVWHADDRGVYHPMGGGDVSDYKSSEINLRGFLYTNGRGEYAFSSIRPGLYTGRRRHIHWRITAEGHQELVTQSYWLEEKGSQREANDFVDTNTEDCRYVDFRDDGDGGVTGVFNIYLRQS